MKTNKQEEKPTIRTYVLLLKIYRTFFYNLFSLQLKSQFSSMLFISCALAVGIYMFEKSTIIVNVLNFTDVISSWISTNFRNAIEVNPIALSMFGIIGYVPFLLLKIFFILGITLVLDHYARGSIYQKAFEAVLIISFGFVTIINFLG